MSTTARLGDSGITLGDGSVADAYGVRWKYNVPNATGNKPAPREDTGDRPNAHGQWDATRYYGPRTRDIAGSARARSHDDLHAAEQRLRDAVRLTLFDLVITEPGFVGVQHVRQSGELQWTDNTHDDTSGYAHASFSFSLYAPDPLIYALDDVTVPLGFPTVAGGLTVPFTVPFTLNAQTVSGRATLTNPSKLPLPLRMHLVGPVTNAAVANPDTGEVLRLARPDGMPLLGAGEYLDVDTERHSVLLLGSASRRSWAYGDWLMLPPESMTTLALSGTGGTQAVALTVAFTPARL